MSNIDGIKIAITGMGKSGIAIAFAAKKRGASPIVYEEKPIYTQDQLANYEKLRGAKIPVISHWNGRLESSDADLLITSPGFSQDHPAIRDMLKKGKQVLSEVEFAYRISKAPIIAITGTNGKSTTTVLTKLLLSSIGYDAILCGNISGSGFPEQTLTEAADESTSDQVLVAEISSFQLEWIDEFKPKVASITNITPDHLDRYSGFEEYYNTKLKIFKNMKKDDKIVLNISEKSLPLEKINSAISKETQIVWFNSTETQHDTEGLLPIRIDNKSLRVRDRNYSLDQTVYKGAFFETNLLQAFACVWAFIGEPNHEQIQSMTEILKDFRGLEHRLEWLGVKNGITIINNSMCTNPAAVIASSKTLEQKQHLLMGGNRKKVDFDSVGQYLNSTNHTAYVFGNQADEMVEQLDGSWETFPKMEEAFEAAVKNAKEGEVIMLAPGCASSGQFSDFRERGNAFKELAKGWLNF